MKNYYLKRFDSNVVYGIAMSEDKGKTTCQIYEINTETDEVVKTLGFGELMKVIFDTRGNLNMTINNYYKLPCIMTTAFETGNYTSTVINDWDIKLVEFINSDTDQNLLAAIEGDVVELCEIVLRHMFRGRHTVEEKIAAIGRSIMPVTRECAHREANEYCRVRGLEIGSKEWEAFFTLVACQYYCGDGTDLVY